MKDLWDDIWASVESEHYRVETLAGNAPPPLYKDIPCCNCGQYIRIESENGIRPFYSWYVPAKKKNSPLLVFIPGADGALRSLPQMEDYHVVFVSPLGYGTPNGIDSSLKVKGTWPVLHDTVLDGKETYHHFAKDALLVVRWFVDEKKNPKKVIFAGCSQGGGIALLLAAILPRQYCIAVCADEPLFIGFSSLQVHDVLAAVADNPYIPISLSYAVDRLQFLDSLEFSIRLTMPVFICSGERDQQCPAYLNKMLFDAIPQNPNNKILCVPGRSHGYSSLFHNAMLQFLRDVAQ